MKTLKMCFIIMLSLAIPLSLWYYQNLDGENQYEQLKKQKNKIITQISKTKEKKKFSMQNIQ